jgi:hypothetical protein
MLEASPVTSLDIKQVRKRNGRIISVSVTCKGLKKSGSEDSVRPGSNFMDDSANSQVGGRKVC